MFSISPKICALVRCTSTWPWPDFPIPIPTPQNAEPDPNLPPVNPAIVEEPLPDKALSAAFPVRQWLIGSLGVCAVQRCVSSTRIWQILWDDATAISKCSTHKFHTWWPCKVPGSIFNHIQQIPTNYTLCTFKYAWLQCLSPSTYILVVRFKC